MFCSEMLSVVMMISYRVRSWFWTLKVQDQAAKAITENCHLLLPACLDCDEGRNAPQEACWLGEPSRDVQ